MLLHKQKKKEREMRIDVLFFILLLAYIHLHTHYNKFRLISNLFFFYRSKFHLILTIIKWLIQYVNSLLKINKLFVFFSFKPSTTATRTGATARTIELELKQNGPYILAGLGVSGGLLLLANRNIPAIGIPILSSAADRVACMFIIIFTIGN